MRSIPQLASLAGRVALVAGGAGHIGSAICDAFEEVGALVAVADLAAPAEASDRAARRWHRTVDLTDEACVRDLVAEVVAAHGRLDVVAHCAALVGTTARPGWAVPIDAQTVEAWESAMRINVTSAFMLAQAARPHLARGGHGAILFVSSIYGHVAPDPALYASTTMATPAGYSASKAALGHLARHLAAAYAPDIRVNTLTPGGIRRGQPDLFIERYEARTPLKRLGCEEDLKGAAAFLASDLSAYVTGHDLVVDGGWTIW